MADIGHMETEKLLAQLEKEIAKEYAHAEKELQAKLDKFLTSYAKNNQKKLAQLAKGEISQADYKRWVTGQIGMSNYWSDMRDTIAQDLTNTNQIAKSIAYSYMPEVYAVNFNYGTYQVEKATHIDTSFLMYDRDAVERLFNDNNTFYHAPGKLISEKINANKDLAWNKRQVQSVLTQSILQGEGSSTMWKRLRATVGDSITASDIKNASQMTAKQLARELERRNRNAAIRNARTMTTGVQNAGRVSAYKRAEEMGINLKQEWLAVMDGRTRHEHRVLDGQKVDVGTPFEVDGYQIEYPGDPKAEGFLVYNCRCTLMPALKGFDDTKPHIHNEALGDMTYDEWKRAYPRNTDDFGGRNYLFNRNLDKQIKAFDKGLKKSNEVVKKNLEKIRAKATILRSKKAKSYYDPTTKEIYIKAKAKPETIAHELGHKLDHTIGATKNKVLQNLIQSDYEELLSRAKEKGLTDYFKEKYPTIFIATGVKAEYAGLSDIVNAMTKGEVSLGYVHSKRYWKKAGKVHKEIFAELCGMYYTNNKNVLFVLQCEFPELTAGFEVLMRKI